MRSGFGLLCVVILFIFLKDKDTVKRLLESSALAIALCILAHFVGLLAQSVTQVFMARTLKLRSSLAWERVFH